MRRPSGAVLLGERPVRWLGGGLLLAGLVLPWFILVLRASVAPDVGDGGGPVTLRPELVALPAGTFMMGSPLDESDRNDDERLHEVQIPRPFMISRTEVTQEHFAAVMRKARLYRGSDYFDSLCPDVGVGDDLPMVCTTWVEAAQYANALSDIEDLTPAYEIDGDEVRWSDRGADGYRLPTEAEWEYAARAGTNTVWVGTNDPERACRYGNVADETAKEGNPDRSTFPCRDGFAALAPVSAREVNGWHLHGLGGNAAEWVWDWYDSYPDGADAVIDEGGPESGSDRVIRGGSWGLDPRFARVANRLGDSPGIRSDDVGFRLARSCPSAVLPSECLQEP